MSALISELEHGSVPLRRYRSVAIIEAVQVGAGTNQIRIDDPALLGGYLIWTGDEGSEWQWIDQETFESSFVLVGDREVV